MRIYAQTLVEVFSEPVLINEHDTVYSIHFSVISYSLYCYIIACLIHRLQEGVLRNAPVTRHNSIVASKRPAAVSATFVLITIQNIIKLFHLFNNN